MAHPAGIAYQVVTDKIVAALEAGTAPWQKPWKPGQGPTNIVSGNPYRGVNVFLLQLAAMEKGYQSKYWLTFAQMLELGGELKNVPVEDREEGDKTKSGQHPTLIVWWSMVKDRKSDDPNARIPLIKYFRVFNLDQTQYVRIPKGREQASAEFEDVELEPNEIAEVIIARYLDGGPSMQDKDDKAWYMPDADLINLPPYKLFEGKADEYYVTAFHELGHSTGHRSRLAREGTGSHAYGREELVAEMTATFLASEAGIESTFDNSAAYLNGWMRVIKEDIKAVVWAAGQANRAADLILGRVPDAPADDGNESARVLVEQ